MRARRSVLSRLASTRMAALSTVWVRLRSARPRTDANSLDKDKNRSSAGRENHSVNAPNALAATYVNLIAAAEIAPAVQNLHGHGTSPRRAGRKPLSAPNPSRRTPPSFSSLEPVSAAASRTHVSGARTGGTKISDGRRKTNRAFVWACRPKVRRRGSPPPRLLPSQIDNAPNCKSFFGSP